MIDSHAALHPADFNKQHFHKLYVYACLKSTMPHGLFQMTGRIRRLETNLIQCCIGKGISFSNHPAPTTTEEQRAEIGWRRKEQKAVGAMKTVRVAGGGLAVWPEDSAVNNVMASNEAKIVNGQRRFFAEIKELLGKGGHRVEVCCA